MAQLKDLVVNGDARIVGKLYADQTLSDGVYYLPVSGTAAVTTSPYTASLWYTTTNNARITSLYDGLTITIKVPVAGNGTYGTLLDINGLGYHPVCANVNSHVSTRYAVGCMITLTYDSTQTRTAYYNSASETTYTGVWKIADYDSNSDTKVQIVETNPTSGTWYYPIWHTATSGTVTVKANDGLRYYSLQGTTSATGKTILQVGNATASGTAGNKVGEMRIYAEKAGYATLKATASATAETVHIFPNTAGTVLNTGTTSFTQTLTSGTEIGTIKINGTSKKIYAPSPGAVSTELVTTNSTYYLTGVTSTAASAADQIYNTRLSNTFTGVKYITSASENGGALLVDDREVTLGLYYTIA